VETKGREDRDVPLKAKAAIAWCEAASTETLQWQYLYIPQGVFERMAGDTVAELARACAPALQNLLQAEEFQDLPLFVNFGQADDDATAIDSLIDSEILNALPSRYRRAADQAVMLYRFFENKEGMNYAPVFTSLLGSIDEDELLKCLFCKLYIELELVPSLTSETSSVDHAKAIRGVFSKVREDFPDIYTSQSEILLDPETIYRVMSD
jgi:hypothetical protein